MLWDANFDENRHERYMADMRNEMPMMRELLRNRRSASVSLSDAAFNVVYHGALACQNDGGINTCTSHTFARAGQADYAMHAASLPDRGIWRGVKDALPAVIYGAPVGESEMWFPVGGNVKTLVFVHSCLGQRKPAMSYRLPVTDWIPAVYAVRYGDGTTVFVNVRFGIDVGHIDMNFGRSIGYEGRTPEDPSGFGTDSGGCPDPPLYEFNKPWKNSLLYSASPFHFCGKCAYIMEWENPKPDAAVERVFAINNAKTKGEQLILFCAAYI
jgi:hypothetical protein